MKTWPRLCRNLMGVPVFSVLVMAAVPATMAQEPEYFEEESGGEVGTSGIRVEWGIEAKVHYRDTDPASFSHTFSPLRQIEIDAVDSGSHFEASVLSLLLTAEWAGQVTAHLKLDAIDRYERNPTSGDRKLDVDELWVRVGHETQPAVIPEEPAYYIKVGKFGAFERQNDRHLESYGLVSTAFNRLEDAGVELGVDLGRHVYLKGSYTQGNPLFFRDPNALAGDNGLGDLTLAASGIFPRELGSGFPILYDAEVEELDFENPEIGVGVGLRFGSLDGRRTGDVLLWHRQRDLAETVELTGTFYGGDLDLLDGPVLNPLVGPEFPLGIRGTKKEEFGANLWLYWDGLTIFGQYADQETAGLERDAWEVEVSYRWELPLLWSLAGRQLFPSLGPAVRYSEMDVAPLGGNPQFPAPSLRWDWQKLDYGLRLTIIDGIDLTIEYADVTTIDLKGKEFELDEFLTTLRWRL